ncbi:putative tocopherol O-methyltransferase [Nymphaea thermarum]|nr:putative tocopherol O-methyltransferase [Nymphaea thermarum]
MNNEFVSDDKPLVVFFQVADALEQPFSDGEFDLVWSMESGEHMPDKKKRTFMKGRLNKGSRPFRLFKPWIMDIDGLDIVKKEWDSIVTGCPMIKFLKKLGLVKAALLRWNAEKFGWLESRIEKLRLHLDQCRLLVENGDLEALKQEYETRGLLKEALRMEEVMWKQRSLNSMYVPGFRLRWIELVMKCVSVVSYEMVVNGCLGYWFTAYKGLRQGKLKKLMYILFFIARRRKPSNMLFFEVTQVKFAGQLRVAGNSYFSDGTNGLPILLNSRGRVLAGELEVLERMFRKAYSREPVIFIPPIGSRPSAHQCGDTPGKIKAVRPPDFIFVDPISTREE